MDAAQRAVRRRDFLAGVRDGVPIGLGYLAVAFSLGIAARSAGLNAFQGLLISLLNNASAGEYAAFTVIAADSGFVEMALITLITNARYLLMSCSLSQKFSPDTPLYHRLLVGYDVTDELFGIAIAARVSRPLLLLRRVRARYSRLGHRHGAGRHSREHPARTRGQRAVRRAVRHVSGDHHPAVEEKPGRARLRVRELRGQLALLGAAADERPFRGHEDHSADDPHRVRRGGAVPGEGRAGGKGGRRA